MSRAFNPDNSTHLSEASPCRLARPFWTWCPSAGADQGEADVELLGWEDRTGRHGPSGTGSVRHVVAGGRMPFG